MSKINLDIQSLTPGTVIELFELDLTVIPGGTEIFRYHNNSFMPKATGEDISASAADNSINSASGNFPILNIGRKVTIYGMKLNRGTWTVVSSTHNKIILSGEAIQNEDAGQTVIVQADAGSVVWKSEVYDPYPVRSGGWGEYSGKGTMPRPNLAISNVTGWMFTYLQAFNDLLGAKITRHQVPVQYLDGMPMADINECFPDEVYYIERKTTENKQILEFELSSLIDLEGILVPRRLMLPNYCSWEYKSAECSWIPNNVYYDITNVRTYAAANDVCSKSLQGCRCRFGNTSVLPFGGFPAMINPTS